MTDAVGRTPNFDTRPPYKFVHTTELAAHLNTHQTTLSNVV